MRQYRLAALCQSAWCLTLGHATAASSTIIGPRLGSVAWMRSL
jgi:hypothetical protein